MSLDLKTNISQINLSLVKGRNCRVYVFENFRLDAANLMLYRGDDEVSLTPKQVETLLALVEKDREIVNKEVLMTRLWGESSVEESNLIQNIHVLRKVLGNTSDGRPMIETFRRRGYRFNGELKNSVADSRPKAFVGASHELSSVPDPDDVSPALVRSRRRAGLIRGLKFLGAGLVIGFVFLVLLQTLLILGGMLARYDGDAASRTSETVRDLLIILTIPIGLGWFTGIGLFLFGIFRMIYAIFEKEGARMKPLTVERVLAAVVCLMLLSVAVPNLIHSYREANRVRAIEKALNGKRSVAVIPLRPVDGNRPEEIYEFGVAESVNSKINAVSGFKSRSLSNLRKYAELEQDAFAVGRDLNVDYVLASDYQIADGQITVTAKLLNVADETVEDEFVAAADSSNAIAAQETIATLLAENFLSKFGSHAGPTPDKRGTTNEQAYRLYLMAMNLSEERGIQNVMKSLEYLDKAVALDPNYALAWAAKARTHADITGHTDSNQQANYQSSMEAISKALAIDPNLSEAYSALCQNEYRYEYDWSGAETACRRAIELDPNSAIAHKIFTALLYSRGRFDEAIDEIKTAMTLQPVSYRNQQMYALTLYFAHRYAEAEDQFKRLLELSPNHTYIHGRLVLVLQEQGKDAEAFEYLIELMNRQNAKPEDLERFRTAYRTSGWRGVIRERIKTGALALDASKFQIACMYAKLGDRDKAFENLEAAYKEHSGQIAVIRVEPQLESLRGDPRYASLLRRIDGH